MIRIIIVVSAMLLVTSSIVHAEEREPFLLKLGYKDERMQRADRNVSAQEYEETYSRNRKIFSDNLESYSKNALGLIGIPEQGANLMGVALGAAVNGARLDLNKSKTLGLELKDVGNSDRTIYFGINLDW
jgi:hypothetical protein